jgi:predicted nuclease with TOPRIM domain
MTKSCEVRPMGARVDDCLEFLARFNDESGKVNCTRMRNEFVRLEQRVAELESELEELKCQKVSEAGSARCQCRDCMNDGQHDSDCRVHNEPAEPWKPCSCGMAP